MTKKIGSCIIAATLIVAAAMAFGPTTTAQAGTTDLTCFAAFEFDFKEPLTATHTDSDATLRGTVVNCNGLPGLLSATAKGIGKATSEAAAANVVTGACNLLLTITGVGSLDWNTGTKSKFDYTVNTNPLNGAITLSAVITSGELVGYKINAVPLLAHPNLDCVLNGLSRLTSELSVVTFTH